MAKDLSFIETLFGALRATVDHACRTKGYTRAEFVEPIAAFLYLRLVDLEQAELAAVAEFNGDAPPVDWPAALRWPNVGPEGLVPAETWPALRAALLNRRGADGRDGPWTMPHGVHSMDLAQAIDNGLHLGLVWPLLDPLPVEATADRRNVGRVFAELVRSLADTATRNMHTVQEPVATLIATLAKPTPGCTIVDPWCGFGDLLTACAMAPSLAREADATSRGDTAPVRVYAAHLQFTAQLVSTVRALLAGPVVASVQVQGRPGYPTLFGLEGKADVVVTNPPIGGDGQLLAPLLGSDRPLRSETAFVEFCLRLLAPGGRAVMLVPPSLLFRDGPDVDLRKRMATEFALESVILLPGGAALPGTKLAMVLVVVSRRAPLASIRMVRLGNSDDPGMSLVDRVLPLLTGPAHAPAFDVAIADLPRNDWRLTLHFPGRDLSAKLREISPELDVRPLGELAEVIPGLSRATKQLPAAADDFPLVLPGDLGEVRVRTPKDNIARVWAQAGDRDRRLRAGDVVVPQVARKLRGSIVSNGAVGAIAGPGTLVVRPSDALLPGYLECLFRSEAYNDWFASQARIGSVPSVSRQELAQMPIAVLAQPLQQRIVDLCARPGADVLAVLRTVVLGAREPFLEALAIDTVLAAAARGPGGIAGQPPEISLADLGQALWRLLEWMLEAHLRDGPGGTQPEFLWLRRLKACTPAVALVQDAALDTAERFSLAAATAREFERVGQAVPSGTWLDVAEVRNVVQNMVGLLDVASGKLAADFRLELTLDRIEQGGSGPVAYILLKNLGTAPLVRVDGCLYPIDAKSVRFQTAALRGGGELQIELPLDLEEHLRDSPVPEVTRDQEHVSMLASAYRLDGQPAEIGNNITLTIDFDSAPAGSATLGPNPYITGSGVTDSRMFFGRDALMAEIKSQLSPRGTANVVLIEGNRRTGKSSILQQLRNPEVLTESIVAYCSFQSAIGDADRIGVPTHQVFQSMAMAIAVACCESGVQLPLPSWPADTAIVRRASRSTLSPIVHAYFKSVDALAGLEAIVEAAIAAAAPRRLVLLLDEFDKLQEGVGTGVTAPSVPGNIRYLFQTYSQMAGAIAGAHQLRQQREGYWSALFGFGYRVQVGPLADGDARKLVVEPVRGELYWAPDAAAEAARLCARQPFLIQHLCRRVFERARESGHRRIGLSEVALAAQNYAANSEHFATLWSDAATERRRYVLWLVFDAESRKELATYSTIEALLEQTAVIRTSGDRPTADIDWLVDMELIEPVQRSHGTSYKLKVPLLAEWLRIRVDGDEQRSKAQVEADQEET